MTNNHQNNLSPQEWQLLIVGLFWASLTGVFVGSPKSSLSRLLIALLIVVIYAFGICQFRRQMMWLTIGITIMINIILTIIYPGAPIVYYLVAMTISVNFLLFGELGIKMLNIMNPFTAFLRLSALFAMGLTSGWLVSAVFANNS